jgi:hypothetical protein
MKEDKMGEACREQGRDKSAYKNLVGKSQGLY